MPLKVVLNDNERFGLTTEEIKMAEKYLKKHKTAGALRDSDAMLLYELFMIGTSFKDMHLQYPQYPLEQIILTAALRKWPSDRNRMMSSLKERVSAKVVKSVVESVDFLTSMLSVATVENIEQMRRYIQDPENNPKPAMRIQSIKEYKDILETLQKLVDGATNPNKQTKSNMFGTLEAPVQLSKKTEQNKTNQQEDPAILLAEAVEE
jgi:hypothetical protein